MKNQKVILFKQHSNGIIAVVMLSLFLAGCNGPSTEGRPVIITKYFQSENPCICRYYYNGLGIRQQDFTDSCSKYNVGDTIK